MARKLKVFSADLGFVRAVVAAASRKAALDAWGVHDDLFSRGSAREVTGDEALMAEAVAKPGEVLRKPIASGADIVQSARKPSAGSKTVSTAETKPAAKAKSSKPPPSRAALDKAEASLKDAQAARKTAFAALEAEQAELDARRSAAEAEQDRAVSRNQQVRDGAKAAYDKALKGWSG